MRKPMREQIIFIVSVNQMPPLPAFSHNTAQQHTSSYRSQGCYKDLYQDIKIHIGKHVNTQMFTHGN